MRRAVERFLEDPMAEELLRGTVKEGDKVKVTRDKDKLVFATETAAPAAPALTETTTES
jgi:ATP-dependent Clp protease ATP-binding subunit ClpC